VIELAADRKEEASRLADQAVAADPRSPAAALAASFSAQAAFDIARRGRWQRRRRSWIPELGRPGARGGAADERGGPGGARKSAEEAVKRNPKDARALSVLGFVELASFRSAEAEKLFSQAVDSDPGLSLAHLGLGIARIRLGNVAGGREELQTATIIDPGDSLLRSYLGKAYYEERRSKEASGRSRPPRSSTPAIRPPISTTPSSSRTRTAPWRPCRTCRSRSRATTGGPSTDPVSCSIRTRRCDPATSPGSTTTWGSSSWGSSLPGGAPTRTRPTTQPPVPVGNYRNTPEYAPAFLSEVLQARIYQPVNVNAARPDVVNETVSFNEYTALFDRPRTRGFGSLVVAGRTDTDLDSLSPSDPSLLDPVTLGSSRFWDGSVTGTVNGDRYAAP